MDAGLLCAKDTSELYHLRHLIFRQCPQLTSQSERTGAYSRHGGSNTDRKSRDEEHRLRRDRTVEIFGSVVESTNRQLLERQRLLDRRTAEPDDTVQRRSALEIDEAYSTLPRFDLLCWQLGFSILSSSSVKPEASIAELDWVIQVCARGSTSRIVLLG